MVFGNLFQDLTEDQEAYPDDRTLKERKARCQAHRKTRKKRPQEGDCYTVLYRFRIIRFRNCQSSRF